MSEIVLNPETNKPARKEVVVSYVDLDRVQLEADVAAKQSELEAATKAVEDHKAQEQALLDSESKAEAALAESKSELEQYDAVAPEPTPGESGDEQPSDGTEASGDSVDGVSEQPGDSTESVTVAVEVVESVDEY